MKVRFTSGSLQRLETDPGFMGGHAADVVRMYRKRLNFIRQAADERDFYNMKSLHFEKLKGARSEDRSVRLNDQVLRFEGEGSSKTVVITSIEDYH